MQTNKVIAIAKHPRDSVDIVIYENTWTNHALQHEELKDCGIGDCLNEVIETLNNPNIIREGRKPETEELFVRYTTQLDFGTFEGFSVSTRTDGNKTFMTTAYHDVIQPTKGKVIWTKGTSNE